MALARERERERERKRELIGIGLREESREWVVVILGGALFMCVGLLIGFGLREN